MNLLEQVPGYQVVSVDDTAQSLPPPYDKLTRREARKVQNRHIYTASWNIFCCFLCGVPALYHALKSRRQAELSNYQKAQEHLIKSYRYNVIAAVTGFTLVLLAFCYYLFWHFEGQLELDIPRLRFKG